MFLFAFRDSKLSVSVFMSCCLPSCFKNLHQPSHLPFSRANQVHSRKPKVKEAIQKVKGHIATNNLIPVIIKIKNVWIQHGVCESTLFFFFLDADVGVSCLY